MAIINGVTVNWRLSPRVVTIPTSETTVTIEDLQDTLLDLEDDDEGMLWPHLRETSGGEALGGGTFVGWTMELQDAQIAFAPRTTNVESGTITTPDTNGVTLTDSTALFVTNGVTPGATVVNFTDQSVTTVISIDSETQLTCYALADGTDNQFDSADVYKVWNEIQCEAQGGNLVAVDSGDSELSAIFPTFGTQVLKTSSSSATTQELADIQHSSYSGGVWLDFTNGVDGTEHPAGNEQNPVKTWSSAVTRANAKGFRRIFVLGDYTFGASDVLDGYEFVGESPNQTKLTFTAGCSTDLTEFISCHLTGTLNGALSIINCHIMSLLGVGGSVHETSIHNCLFMPTGGASMTLTAGATKTINIIDCWSGSSGDTPITISWNSTGPDGVIRSWDGGFKITNMTNGQEVSFDSSGAHLQVDATSTSGTIVYRGSTKFTDTGSSLTTTDQTTAALNWAYSAALTVQKWIGLR